MYIYHRKIVCSNPKTELTVHHILYTFVRDNIKAPNNEIYEITTTIICM